MSRQPCPCLRLVDSSQCPSADVGDALPNCDISLAVGALCEGDGECYTSRTANNCNGNQDVYMRCESTVPEPPRAPPSQPASPPSPSPPPPPPHPPFSPLLPCTSVCAAGCDSTSCLNAVEPSDCPEPIAADTLPPCDAVAPGELCEADGECRTSKTINNCHRWRDVYRREACIPMSDTLPQASVGGLLLVPASLILCSGLAGVALVLLVLVLCCRRRRERAATEPKPTTVTRGPRAETMVVVNAL